MTAVLRHPGTGAVIVVGDDQAGQYALSGWIHDDGRPIDVAKSLPSEPWAPHEPGSGPKITIYHPELDRSIEITAEALRHYRPGGWVTPDEWAETQAGLAAQAERAAKAEDKPARPPRRAQPEDKGAGGEPATTNPEE